MDAHQKCLFAFKGRFTSRRYRVTIYRINTFGKLSLEEIFESNSVQLIYKAANSLQRFFKRHNLTYLAFFSEATP